jgi:exopolysaccharide biosynthesis polyprenyl glycosylphosphotransferase
VNVRRSGNRNLTLGPIPDATTPGDRGILTAEAFRRMITLERKRSERSRKPFILLLIDTGDASPTARNGRILGKILTALSASTRDTDLTGWYSDNCVVGVMFTEIGIEGAGATPNTIISRVTQTLQNTLTLEQFNQVTLSFHVFPEDWDHDAEQGPTTNRTLYPDLSQREDRRKLFHITKRTMDILGSMLAIVFFSPIFLIIAVAVKASSRGPVLFKQRRVGQHGNSFKFWKFRSMYVNNDSAVHKEYVKQLIAGTADKHPSNGSDGVYKLTKDPRITPVGAFLRKTSLDELPQFFNVLKGEMSLVGPRPPIPYEVEAYDIWHRRRLLEAKPGITGLWQVSGRCRVKFDDMVRLDLQYARNWSPWMDVKILLRTPGAVVLGDGAH